MPNTIASMRRLFDEAETDPFRNRLRHGVEGHRALFQQAAEETAEADRFDVLATLIEAYERVRWPIAEADLVDVIRYRMETHGYTQADLAHVLGSRARASEVMRGKRPLSLSMIRRLAGSWEIPVEALVDPLNRAAA
jgi:antitoxin component HigA of HigAB toxin-antitoxin module